MRHRREFEGRLAKLTWSIMVASVVSLAGCASNAGTRPPESSSVCFLLKGSWAEIGDFQSLFVPEGSLLPGTTGFQLSISPDFLRVDLDTSVDPKVWLADLGSEIINHRAVASTFVSTDGSCEP